MRFGLFFLMQRDERWSEQAVYDSDLAQMLAAEALGYESVWIAEHHFNDYGLCPAPQVLAAFLAARTSTIRLGMGVSLLPLHHHPGSPGCLRCDRSDPHDTHDHRAQHRGHTSTKSSVSLAHEPSLGPPSLRG